MAVVTSGERQLYDERAMPYTSIFLKPGTTILFF